MTSDHNTTRPIFRSFNHLEEFHIGAFRGVKDVHLDRLSKFNLLVGNNNCGKTSVLEAIAAFSSPSDLLQWSTIARNREVRPSGFLVDQSSIVDGIRWMFPIVNADVWGHGDSGEILLQGMAGDLASTLTATCEEMRGLIPAEVLRKASPYLRINETDDAVENTGWHINVVSDFETEGGVSQRRSYDFDLWSQLGLRAIEPSRPKNKAIQYLAPYSHRNSSVSLRRLTAASIKNKRPEIDWLLKELDHTIAGVEIVTSEDGRFPKIAIRYQSGMLLPLSILGDGLRRALSIALALQESKNSILLIDEIEAALHTKALDRVYRWLRDASEHYNVQIFSSTHSLEAINAISKITADSTMHDLSAYSISKDPLHSVKRYTGGMLYRLVHERGYDIR